MHRGNQQGTHSPKFWSFSKRRSAKTVHANEIRQEFVKNAGSKRYWISLRKHSNAVSYFDAPSHASAAAPRPQNQIDAKSKVIR
jgi:hypothetical protein